MIQLNYFLPLLFSCLLQASPVNCFATIPVSRSSLQLAAAPKRLQDNTDGVLFVNDRCINCSACSQFAPSVFERSGSHHVVHTQPQTESDIENARAALAACPVAAIRVETAAHRHHRGEAQLTEQEENLAKNLALSSKLNGRDMPFPRKLVGNVWFLGHHNEASFGATPYLTNTVDTNGNIMWIMVDTPKFSNSAVKAVTGLTGPNGPDYLLLTHVDDTADHGKWREEFPNLKRIFHSGDLGRHNWIGDRSLEQVEILLEGKSDDDELAAFDLHGNLLTPEQIDANRVVIYSTPGHSPGSISMLHNDAEVLFTGDTLAFSTRTNTLSGFPRYGNNRRLQAETLAKLERLKFQVIAPGHGHVRDYRLSQQDFANEMQEAREELVSYANRW
jgi:glyoxylase-like metal-dependent hydrolase (beta-lactamase superfamily II)/ferredoxin